MTSSDDDEDLKRAIAMSLGLPVQDPPSPPHLVEPAASDDDEDLRKAIALSLQGERTHRSASDIKFMTSHELGHANPNSDGHQQTQPLAEAQRATSTAAKPPPGLFGLNRKAMEQERLARLGKRKRSPSPERRSKIAPQSSEPVEDSSEQSPIQYPRGTVKRTWAFKHPRTNDIKIEEVLQASTNSISVLSSFQWDDRWVYSKLDPKKTKQIWIMSAKGRELQDELLKQATDAKVPNLRPHFPPMGGQIQHMHSKLMLLFHPTHLRIAVPTANMLNIDWGETNKDPKTGESWQPAVMENSVFLIDLPRRSDESVGNKEDLTMFGKELVHFLEAQKVRPNLIAGVLKHEFSETQHIAFVHSIGGNHLGKARDRTGLHGLSKAIRRLGLDQVQDLELDYASSSLGALKESFLKQLYMAACGRRSLTQNAVPADFLDRIRIYFPSRDTVVESTGGPDCGGIITLNRRHYGAAFPKQCMRDYKSTRPGVLSHNKMLLGRGRKKDNSPFAWAYIGSANLSESAWGAQRVLKGGQEGALNVRNWECGVLVPVPEESLKDLKLADGEPPPMSVFEGTLEVPFEYPGGKYDGKDGKEPWFFQQG